MTSSKCKHHNGANNFPNKKQLVQSPNSINSKSSHAMRPATVFKCYSNSNAEYTRSKKLPFPKSIVSHQFET
nr:hypothetical protein CFP56_79741 [Quercus suber]